MILAAIMMVVTRTPVAAPGSSSIAAGRLPGSPSVVGGAAGGPTIPSRLPDPEAFSLACKLLNGETKSIEVSFSETFRNIKKRLEVRYRDTVVMI